MNRHSTALRTVKHFSPLARWRVGLLGLGIGSVFFGNITDNSPTRIIAGIFVYAAALFVAAISADPVKSNSGRFVLPLTLLFVVSVISTIALLFHFNHDSPGLLANLWMLLALHLLTAFYVSRRGIHELLIANAISGIPCVVLASILHRDRLMKMQLYLKSSEILVHKNLLAFVLAGFFGAFMYFYTSSKTALRYTVFPFAILCLYLVFYSSSRGSLFAILISLAVAGTLYAVRGADDHAIHRNPFKRIACIIALFILTISAGLLNTRWVETMADEASSVLELTSRYRGVGSGLTGRTDIWAEVFRKLDWGDYLIGFGFRRSTEIASDPIDNGYIVLLAENGVLVFLIIVSALVFLLYKLLNLILLEAPQLADYGLLIILLIYFANNFVARYLYALGNTFSLMGLALMSAPFFPEVARLNSSCKRILPFIPFSRPLKN